MFFLDIKCRNISCPVLGISVIDILELFKQILEYLILFWNYLNESWL